MKNNSFCFFLVDDIQFSGAAVEFLRTKLDWEDEPPSLYQLFESQPNWCHGQIVHSGVHILDPFYGAYDQICYLRTLLINKDERILEFWQEKTSYLC